MAAAATFEEHLAREIMVSERLRALTLVRLAVALLAVFGVLFALFHDEYRHRFNTPVAIGYVVAILVLLLAHELALLRALGRRLAGEGGVPTGLRYLNAFVETSVPSLMIVAVAQETEPTFVLQSGAVLLYGVFIVLSTMLLDPRLSAFTGLVAAVEYVALCVFYQGGGAAGATPFGQPPFYLAKGAILALCGLAAGFVAQQIRRRVGNAYRTLRERQRVLDAFGQQVSPAIAEELLRSGTEAPSRHAAVCVMFMDIRDFTRLVEDKSPEQIVALQNAVFSEAAEVVNRNRGVINQFLGDGFMATFGAPIATGRECADALAAARELLDGIRALSDAGRIPRIAVGIGLHAGEAVSGNIGSELRRQYSVTGNVVILASRIEQLNKEFGSHLLVSREVLERAGAIPPGSTALGPVSVKGREQPIELYRIA